MVILFVEQIRFAEKKKGGTLLPFRGRPVVPCIPAAAGAGPHLYPAQQGSARRRSLAWRGLIRLSWVLAAVTALPPSALPS